MKTIRSNINKLYEIKNSKFITLLYKINKDTDINSLLNEAKELYPKATHYTYAYRLTDYQKASDDGEPGGTAGTPMLNVLIKEDIVNVLAICVRYFGGIKLGAGGLVRAYTKSLTDAIEVALFDNLINGFIIEIEVNYDDIKQLDYILRDFNIINKEFNETIKYTVEMTKEQLDLIKNYDYKIIKEELIELI